MRQRRRRTIRIVVVALVLVALIPVALPAGSDGALDASNRQPVGGISDGISAMQQFPAHGSAIRGVTVYLGTYGRVNNGTLHLSVFAETNNDWQRLATRDVNETNVQDNSYTTLVFSPPLPVTQGKGVRLLMEASAPDTDAVTWWTNPLWSRPGYQLTYNAKPIPGTAVFEVHYLRESHPLILALGGVWPHVTAFLTALWQGILLLALLGVVASAFLIFRRVPEEEDVSSQPAAIDPG